MAKWRVAARVNESFYFQNKSHKNINFGESELNVKGILLVNSYPNFQVDIFKTNVVKVFTDENKPLFITSEREARSEFLLIYTKNLSMSGRGHAFERLISLEP